MALVRWRDSPTPWPDLHAPTTPQSCSRNSSPSSSPSLADSNSASSAARIISAVDGRPSIARVFFQHKYPQRSSHTIIMMTISSTAHSPHVCGFRNPIPLAIVSRSNENSWLSDANKQAGQQRPSTLNPKRPSRLIVLPGAGIGKARGHWLRVRYRSSYRVFFVPVPLLLPQSLALRPARLPAYAD